MSYGPRSLAEDVDEHRPVGRVQDLFLLQPAPTSGVEYERNLMHTDISFKRSPPNRDSRHGGHACGEPLHGWYF